MRSWLHFSLQSLFDLHVARQRGFGDEARNRRITMAPSKKQNDWKKSIGRKLLFNDIKSGAIPDGMDYKTAFKSRPEFAVGKNVDDAARLFETRLKSARKIIAEKDERAATELALLRED